MKQSILLNILNLSFFFKLVTIFMMNSMRFLLIPSYFLVLLMMDNSGRCGYQFDTQVAVNSNHCSSFEYKNV